MLHLSLEKLSIIDSSRGKCGLLVTGRKHYFDDEKELRTALGLRDSDVICVIDQFSEEEVKSFLQKSGINKRLPEWLPRRPLLLASFACKGLLEAEISSGEDGVDPASAWNRLIDIICEREAKINRLLDAAAIRGFLEQLAEQTRQTADGRGPLRESDFEQAFRSEVGTSPDSTQWPLIMRLPGLAARDSEPGTRHFVDDQLLSAFRRGEWCAM